MIRYNPVTYGERDFSDLTKRRILPRMMVRTDPLRCRGVAYALAGAMTVAAIDPGLAASPPRQAGVITTDAGSLSAAGPEPSHLPEVLGPATNLEKEGYGCLITGGAATALTATAGTEELLLLYGSTVAPTTSIGLGVAVAGTIFASVCVVGALATPAVIRLWKYYYVGIPIVEPN